jgi:hypothetical protein
MAACRWERGRTISGLLRLNAHVGQVQFHWGTPPPAAVPSSLKCNIPLDFRGSVAVDFTSQTNFFHFRAGPDFGLHRVLLSQWTG